QPAWILARRGCAFWTRLPIQGIYSHAKIFLTNVQTPEAALAATSLSPRLQPGEFQSIRRERRRCDTRLISEVSRVGPNPMMVHCLRFERGGRRHHSAFAPTALATFRQQVPPAEAGGYGNAAADAARNYGVSCRSR